MPFIRDGVTTPDIIIKGSSGAVIEATVDPNSERWAHLIYLFCTYRKVNCKPRKARSRTVGRFKRFKEESVHNLACYIERRWISYVNNTSHLVDYTGTKLDELNLTDKIEAEFFNYIDDEFIDYLNAAKRVEEVIIILAGMIDSDRVADEIIDNIDIDEDSYEGVYDSKTELINDIRNVLINALESFSLELVHNIDEDNKGNR